MAKAAKKRAPKKSAKKAAKKRAPKKARKLTNAKRLETAHRHVMRVIESASVEDREGIARVRRALEHAHEATKGGSR